MASVAKLRHRTFQEVDCRRGVEKKSHSRGLERDGLGHQISGAMTSLVIVWFPPYGTQKPRRSPPCPGLFLNRPTSWPSGRTWLRPSLVGAIAVAQGGLASGLSAGWSPGPDRETLSIAELTDHHRLRSHTTACGPMPSEKCVDVTVHLSESTLIIRPPLGVTQVQQILQTLIVCHSCPIC